MSVVDRAEGLLDQIAEQALDDDYYLVRSDPPSRGERLLTGVAAACFALMITVAAVQTQSDRPATERQQQALADDVQRRQDIQAQRTKQVAELTSDVSRLTAAADRTDPALQLLLARTGGAAVRGPGVTVTLTPAATDGGQGDVSDADLRELTNALWFLGAEAISVNGRRLGTLSSIRTAGSAITVNYDSISPPYVVAAIGDREAMRERLEASRLGRYWDARAERTGLGYDIGSVSDLRMDELAEARLSVPHATVMEVAK